MDVRSHPATAVKQRRRRRSSVGHSTQSTPRVAWLLASVVLLAPQLVGALHVPVVIGVAASLTAIFVYAMWSGAISTRLPLPAVALALLAAYSLLQALPLPVQITEHLARANWDAYTRLFDAFGERAPRFLPLSLDPGASRIEAVKWSTYAIAFALAAGVGARGYARSGPVMVLVSALAIAVVTLGHRLAGAQTIFGIYAPTGEFAKSSIGPLLNPNNLAGYLNLGIFCGLGLMLTRQAPWLRWLLAVSVALMVGVVVESRSRGGLVALGVGLVAMALLAWKRLPELRSTRRGRRLLAGVGVTVLAGVALAALAVAPDTFRQGTDGGLKKLAMASWVAPLIRDYPWFGVGRGAFESAFQQYVVGPDNLIYSHPENFIVQWAAEWGVPCAALALVGLLALLRERAAAAFENPVALGALIACCVLLLQNLVDLGTEVPALTIAALVGLGTGWRGDDGASKPLRFRRVFSGALLVLSCGALLAVLVVPVETVGNARLRLDASLEVLTPEPEAGRLAEFREDLKRTMRAHPMDPYFPRLAALVAFRQRDPKALRWIGRALELGPTSGRSHLLLARMLAALGQRSQALLELRFAAAYDPGIAASVAHAALGLTSSPDELARAAPVGQTGARVLLVMADELKDPAARALRLTLLRLAVQRAPELPAAQRQLASLLMSTLEGDGEAFCAGAQREGCVREADSAARALERLSPTSSDGLEARARLLVAMGQGREASELLKARCEEFEERRSCLTMRLRAALTTGDVSEMERAIVTLGNDSCRSTEDCANLAGSIADLLVRASRHRAALPFYIKAAKEDGQEKRWLRVADVAGELGEYGVAVQALTSVQARRRRFDPKLQAKIDVARSKLFLEGGKVP